MNNRFKKVAGLLLSAAAAFTISINANAAGKTKIADVSQWQGNINWQKASKELKMVLIRVQHGDYGDADFHVDIKKDINAKGAIKYNIPFGQYAYAEFSSVADAKKEANNFYKRANKNANFYVLDNEHRKGRGSEQSYVNAWLKTMRGLTNKPLVYYSYQNFVRVNKINYSKFDGSWIANYSYMPNVKTDLWQYTSKGRVNGIAGNVDLNKVVNSSVVNSWYQTANSASYLTEVPASKTIKTLRNIYRYDDPNFNSRSTKVYAGTTLKVTDVTHLDNGKSRFQLDNGQFVTANTNYVIAQ